MHSLIIYVGNLDFTPIRFVNLDVFETLDQNSRRACFVVSINNDLVFENVETFSLLLSLDPFVPDGVRNVVTIEPNVVYVTILDTMGKHYTSDIIFW